MEPEIGTDTAKEMTLFEAIKELNTLAWKLNGIVFGVKPVDKPDEPKAVVVDKITQARDSIMRSNDRIGVSIKKLKGIGA